MRNALVVGINQYNKVSSLYGSVNDSSKVKKALESNIDGTKNFEVLHRTSTSENSIITKRSLKNDIKWIFTHNSRNLEVALFYFSGHGYIDEETGDGYLVTSECNYGDDGVAMSYTQIITRNKDTYFRSM